MDCTQVDLDCYNVQVRSNLVEAWKLAQERIKKAQLHHKRQHDKSVRHNNFSEEDVVFLYDPSLKKEGLQVCKTFPWSLQDSASSAKIKADSRCLSLTSMLSKRDK